MWLMTKHGFYSISQKGKGQYHIRARERQDLENLITNHGPLRRHKIVESTEADYPYRVIVTESVLDEVMTFFTATLDYSNFKETIHHMPNQSRKNLPYAKIWWVLMDALEACRPPIKKRIK